MAVNLSPLGGVGAQFFNNDGVPLSGGLIYTYLAGTNTPSNTYTSGAGNIPHSNPIVLDSAGRVPTGEIWLLDGISYKFIIKDAQANLIGTYDNLVGINSNFVNYTASQEIQTATAGQTVFTLTTMVYQPNTNSLSVFVDGVNQYGPGAQYAFIETNSTTITFASGLHVGAQVKFTTSAINSSSYGDAFQISYLPPFTNSQGTNVGLKLAEVVSVKDFGAVGDGSTDDYQAFLDAVNYCSSNNVALFVPSVDTYYNIGSSLNIDCLFLAGMYRIFGGTGTITFSANCIHTVFSRWFANDGTGDGYASAIFATGNVPQWIKYDTGVETKIQDDAPAATTYQTRTFVSGAGFQNQAKGVGAYRIDVADSNAVLLDPTKAGILYGIVITIDPVVSRGNVPYDDATGIIVENGGTQKATDAFYVGRGGSLAANLDWNTVLASDAWVDTAIALQGYHDSYGVDMALGTFGATAAALRLPNNVAIVARNAANTNNISVIRLAADDVVQLGNTTTTGAKAKVANTAGGYLELEITSNSTSLPKINFSNYLTFSGPIKSTPTTVGSLMSASIAGVGAKSFVTDATATTFASIVAGGGANAVPVYSDGTNWRIG